MITLKESPFHNSKYFSDTTDMYYYDSLIGNEPLDEFSDVTLKEYYKFEKDVEAYIIYMTPREYMMRCALLQHYDVENEYELCLVNSKVDRYSKLMKSGTKFPIPVIDYVDKTQEGRHRAVALEKINENEKMPVVIVLESRYTKDEYNDYIKRRYGDDAEFFIKT